MENNRMMEIAKVMANLIALEKDFKDDEEFKGNIRKCPFHSERVGMERMLKMMGIDFEYEFDADVNMIGITVDGNKAMA